MSARRRSAPGRPSPAPSSCRCRTAWRGCRPGRWCRLGPDDQRGADDLGPRLLRVPRDEADRGLQRRVALRRLKGPAATHRVTHHGEAGLVHLVSAGLEPSGRSGRRATALHGRRLVERAVRVEGDGHESVGGQARAQPGDARLRAGEARARSRRRRRSRRGVRSWKSRSSPTRSSASRSSRRRP